MLVIPSEKGGVKVDHKNTPSLASSCGARVVFTTSETFVYNSPYIDK